MSCGQSTKLATTSTLNRSNNIHCLHCVCFLFAFFRCSEWLLLFVIATVSLLLIEAEKVDVCGKKPALLRWYSMLSANTRTAYSIKVFPSRDFTSAKRRIAPLVYSLAKFHCLHSDRDEFAAGIIQTDGYLGIFVRPFQYIAAKQITVVVEVFWLHRFLLVNHAE